MSEKLNPYLLTDFDRGILEVYIKCGYGDMKMYMQTVLQLCLNDETALLTIKEFYDRAMTIMAEEGYEV